MTSFLEDNGVLCADRASLGKSKVSLGIISAGRKPSARMEDAVAGKLEVSGE